MGLFLLLQWLLENIYKNKDTFNLNQFALITIGVPIKDVDNIM